MLKQSPNRNQRLKKFKVKHALQVCLLLVICLWLLYQVKQHYDKKVALEESLSQASENVQNGHELIKLGRKDLNPRLEEIAAEFEKHGDDEDDEDEGQDDEESKQIGREDGENGGDGHDHNKAEEDEPEQVEDLIDEEDKE